MKDADWIQQGAAQGTCLSHFLALFLAIVSRMPKKPQNLSFFSAMLQQITEALL